MDNRDLVPLRDEAFDPDADRLREECASSAFSAT
jgi:hypothetical protein